MSDPVLKDTLVVYSDYVCPFCYLGKRSLETYLEQAQDPPEVTWRPFDLRWHKRREDGSIDTGVPDGKDQAYYDRAKRNVERLAEAYDVEMTLDIATDIDPWDAQKATLHVRREHGPAAFEAFHDVVFEALWKDGRDIGDHDVLADAARTAGLDPQGILEAAGDPALDETVRQAFADAHSQGITGVPTFIYNDLRLPGAVPPDDIAKLVENG